MPSIKGVFRLCNNGGLLFQCPGCGGEHHVSVTGMLAKWDWNYDYEKPTFTPSILVRSGHYASHSNGKDCWCTYNAKLKAEDREESKFKCYICHSFITDGKIQFLNDCTHKLAGQTVDLPNYKEN